MKPGEIRAEHASRRFRVNPEPVRTLKELALRRGRPPAAEVWALQDVSLAVEPGDAVGLVGRNGSGKTTLLSLIAGIITPTSGRVEAGGRVASLLELGAGFHPDFSGRENVYLNGSLYGLKRKTIDERFDEIVSFAELERFIDNPVRTYSSGMYMRLGFAVAAHIDADVLLLDEVFAVGDEEFQRKCFAKTFEYKQRGGTIVFVSHDAASVERLCQRAVLLRDGRVDLDGSAQEAIARYHKLLADERDPAEGAAGLSEYGSGEARITSSRLLGPEGEDRLQLAAGGPWSSSSNRRARGDPAAAHLDRAPGRGGSAALGSRAGHFRARLAGASGRARRPLRGRAAAARRRTVPAAVRTRRPHRPPPLPLAR
jgi:ABC-type polysaccharide/polyol phosphate transport system ATPase subunit